MIDIKELRRLAQAATPGPWGNTDPDPTIINSPYNQLAICYRNSRALTDAKFIAAANPAAISELLDRLEAAESDGLEQARLLGMSGEREAALLSKLEAAEKERDALRAELNEIRYGVAVAHDTIKALRAKIEAMEKQEPVGQFIQHPSNGLWEQDGYGDNPDARPLYALPGAQGEEK